MKKKKPITFETFSQAGKNGSWYLWNVMKPPGSKARLEHMRKVIKIREANRLKRQSYIDKTP